MKKITLHLFLIIIPNFLFALDDSDIFLDSVYFTAIKKSNYEKVMSMLGKGVSPNILDSDSLVGLAYALENEDIKMFDLLIKQGADLNKKIQNGSSILIFYVANKRFQNLDHLLKSGANVNFQDKLGRNVVMHAIEKMNIEALKILLDSGFDDTATDFSGKDIYEYSRLTRNNSIRNLIDNFEPRH